jgi:N-acylneuraminate cytidylyltransferase
MKKIAIIPARGGSKRIPRKNIKNFLGKPCIAYSVENAIKTNLFDEIMVSTDDQEIADIAIKYGAKVPFYRSEKNSNDIATTSDVLIEVLNEYEKLNLNFEIACCIYPTTPLLTSDKLNAGFELFKNEDYNVVLSSVKYSHPIQRAFSIEEDGKIQLISPENEFKRTQDLEKYYHDAGQFYWFKKEYLKRKKSLLNGKIGAVIIDESMTQDIDNYSDWSLAEYKYKILNKIN